MISEYHHAKFGSSPEETPVKNKRFDSKSLVVDLDIEEKSEYEVNRKEDAFILLPNEWKLAIAVYFGVLIGAVFFNVAIAHPTNLLSTISNFSHDVLGLYPAAEDLLFLAILLGFSIPLISCIFIPILLKMCNKWVFDQVVKIEDIIANRDRPASCREIIIEEYSGFQMK